MKRKAQHSEMPSATISSDVDIGPLNGVPELAVAPLALAVAVNFDLRALNQLTTSCCTGCCGLHGLFRTS